MQGVQWPLGRVMSTEEYVKETGGDPPTKAGGAVMLETPFSKAILDGMAMDGVDQPAHYARRKMQAIEYIAINKLEWWEANVIKYIARWDGKDGLKDLYKARSYLDMKIREVEGHERFWEKPVATERKLNGR